MFAFRKNLFQPGVNVYSRRRTYQGRFQGCSEGLGNILRGENSRGRAFEPEGRNIISVFETLDTNAEPGLLRVVRFLGLCGVELCDDMT